MDFYTCKYENADIKNYTADMLKHSHPAGSFFDFFKKIFSLFMPLLERTGKWMESEKGESGE